jgi:hypothetical protein
VRLLGARWLTHAFVLVHRTQAQDSFARSWGISYGLNAATEWKARRRVHAQHAHALSCGWLTRSR